MHQRKPKHPPQTAEQSSVFGGMQAQKSLGLGYVQDGTNLEGSLHAALELRCAAEIFCALCVHDENASDRHCPMKTLLVSS